MHNEGISYLQETLSRKKPLSVITMEVKDLGLESSTRISRQNNTHVQ